MPLSEEEMIDVAQWRMEGLCINCGAERGIDKEKLKDTKDPNYNYWAYRYKREVGQTGKEMCVICYSYFVSMMIEMQEKEHEQRR